MLVLSRKPGESLILGDEIVVIRGGDKVRIGIEAPPEVVILREELVARDESMQKEQP